MVTVISLKTPKRLNTFSEESKRNLKWDDKDATIVYHYITLDILDKMINKFRWIQANNVFPLSLSIVFKMFIITIFYSFAVFLFFFFFIGYNKLLAAYLERYFSSGNKMKLYIWMVACSKVKIKLSESSRLFKIESFTFTKNITQKE